MRCEISEFILITLKNFFFLSATEILAADQGYPVGIDPGVRGKSIIPGKSIPHSNFDALAEKCT